MKTSDYKFFLIAILTLLIQTAKADICRILDKEEEALQCRVDMIVRAKSELLVSTYIIREDAVGLGLLKLMIECAARGVKVKMILDSFGKDIPNSLLDYLTEKGVEIHSFNQVRLFAPHTITDRLHEKVMLTDVEHIIVGGRNLTSAYYKLEPEGNFLDREMYAISKKVADELRTHFFTMWNRPKLTQKKKHKPLTDENRLLWQKKLDEAWQAVMEKTKVVHDSQIDWLQGSITTQTHATYDNFVLKQNGQIIPAERKNRRGTKQLISLIDSAKYSIDIENPYFHPTKKWGKAFKKALSRGVKIRVVTNSECTNDVLLMQSVYRRSRGKYLKMGISLSEFEGNATLHTKSFVIDSTVAIVGSYNIHSVSEKRNAEVCLWVHDKTIALQTLAAMSRCLSSAKPIDNTKHNRSIWHIEKNAQCSKKHFKYILNIHTLGCWLNWYL